MRDRIGVRVMPGTSSTLSPRYWLGALGLIATALFCAYAAPLAQAVGLPNGRVYEQVSPYKKNGNTAGALGFGSVGYSFATADGESLLYEVSGALEGFPRGMATYALAKRSPSGWHSVSPVPFPGGQINYANFGPAAIQPADDLSRFTYTLAGGGLVPGNPSATFEPGGSAESAGAEYMAEPGGKLSWITEPKIPTPLPAVGHIDRVWIVPAGGSPNLDTYYFSYTGTLVPEDASRTPNVVAEPTIGGAPAGFYRWHDGELINYGSLPDGSFDPYGAVQAGFVENNYFNNTATPAFANNQVTEEGNEALYVSPDPRTKVQSGRVSQLYVRRGNAPAILVSKSEVTGLPSESGPYGFTVTAPYGGNPPPSYAYGSADGSHVYFESVDALTADAPATTTEKAYLFDVETEDLQYLSGVRGEPVAARPDLSAFIFARIANGGLNKARVGVWANGSQTTFWEAVAFKYTLNGRVTPDGNSLIFGTDAPLPGFNSGGYQQVYRYDIPTEEISCISCPPETVSPEGPAEIAHASTSEPGVWGDGKLRDSRGMSTDGNRVFFDSPDPLVPQDANGVRDVYMWEDGQISLISTGRSGRDSYLLDNSESGNDVFFATAEGLAPEDTDGAYDVYDARVGGGFKVANPPASCSSGCQTTESAPGYTDAGSSTFSGAGNAKPHHKKKAHHKKKSNKKSKHSKQAKHQRKGAH